MKYQIKHFKLAEFACPCCGRTSVVVPLVFWVDVLRDAVGHPLKISSGYRCINHNRDVDGALASRHMIGCAVDISCPKGMDFNVFLSIARRFAPEGFEIKEYLRQAYIHFGVPRSAAESKIWTGAPEVTL